MREDNYEGWCRNTDMLFAVVNHADPARSRSKRAKLWFPIVLCCAACAVHAKTAVHDAAFSDDGDTLHCEIQAKWSAASSCQHANLLTASHANRKPMPVARASCVWPAETQTTFHGAQTDWGFNDFLEEKEVSNPASGFLQDDSLTIRVEVSVRLPTGQWYDSKRETGYVGLKNQGATCYLNSWLQTLFHINIFRRVRFAEHSSYTTHLCGLIQMRQPPCDRASQSVMLHSSSVFRCCSRCSTSRRQRRMSHPRASRSPCRLCSTRWVRVVSTCRFTSCLHLCRSDSCERVGLNAGLPVLQMQFLPLNASTQDLTRSFGWDQYGALMQEDVHEFNKILCDALEEKMKVCLRT